MFTRGKPKQLCVTNKCREAMGLVQTPFSSISLVNAIQFQVEKKKKTLDFENVCKRANSYENISFWLHQRFEKKGKAGHCRQQATFVETFERSGRC